MKCLLEEYHVQVQEHAIGALTPKDLETSIQALDIEPIRCPQAHAFHELITSYRVNEPQKLETIELFLKHGADPNQRVYDSWDQTSRRSPRMTILHALCHQVHAISTRSHEYHEHIRGCVPGSTVPVYYPAVALLLQFGADPNAEATNGASPISFALARRNHRLHALLSSDIGPRRVPSVDPPSHPMAHPPSGVMANSSVASPQPGGKAGKRKVRPRETPMDVRAEKAGVADDMQPLPSDTDAPGYKERRREVQKANQQIVARAEEKLSKGNREPRRSPRKLK